MDALMGMFFAAMAGAAFGALFICGAWYGVDLIIGTETLTADRASGVTILSTVAFAAGFVGIVVSMS